MSFSTSTIRTPKNKATPVGIQLGGRGKCGDMGCHTNTVLCT